MTIETKVCGICAKRYPTDNQQQICGRCATSIHTKLNELPNLHAEAHNCLEPHKGGHGGNTGEPTLGINLTALDYINGKTILDVLHGWERIIREERKLTPPAYLTAQPTIEAEILTALTFQLTHHTWIIRQEWADEYGKEIFAIHATGQRAARQYRDPIRRIACPTENTDGTYCNRMLSVTDPDPSTVVTCTKCHTTWTVARLIAVGTSDPNREMWIDAESIGTWLGITAGQVRRQVTKHNIPKRGQLIELTAYLNHHQK